MSEITGQQAVSRLLAGWSAARAALAEIERVEHPDVTDKFGRVWVWKSKDLYRHCGTAAPVDMIDGFALPTQAVLDNPNYDLCSVCVDGRERNVPDCKPEWNCSHTMHAAPTAVPDMAAKTLPREPWRGSQICGYQLSCTTWTLRASYCGERKAHGLAYCREHHLDTEMEYGDVVMAPGNARGDASAPLALLWEPWDDLEPVQPTAEEIAAYAATHTD